MDEILLRVPEPSDAEAIWDFRAEMLESSMDGCASLNSAPSAQAWIAKVRAREKPENCPENIVPSHAYLAIRVRDGRLVGMLQLRHHIDHPVLAAFGGHIGYTVRPNERRKGYASEMLRQCLDICRERGLDRVLISCLEDNIGSEKTILKNGGVYEKTVEARGNRFKRFWITL